jgi:hypothetical protein
VPLALLVAVLVSQHPADLRDVGEVREVDLRDYLMPLGGAALGGYVGAMGTFFVERAMGRNIELGDRAYLLGLSAGMAAGLIGMSFFWKPQGREHGQAVTVVGALLGAGVSWCSLALEDTATVRAVMSPLTVLLPILTTALVAVLVYGAP